MPIVHPRIVVHTEYDIESPPSKPQGHWTRFICISDTHEAEFPVPTGDVLLHSGDLTHTGRYNGIKKTVEWLSELPHPTKMSAEVMFGSEMAY